MSPRCSPSGRGRALTMAGLALGSALALFAGCGTVAPDVTWSPSAADTASIESIVNANKAMFKTSLAELALVYSDTVLPGSTPQILRNELQGNPFKQRFRANAFQHEFPTDSLQYSFIAGLDTTGAETTCTVVLAETLVGNFKLHAFSLTRYLRESLFYPSPTETLRLSLYDTVLTPIDTVVSKTLTAVAANGCVLRKTGGQWQLWKLAGGTRLNAPTPEDAPYFYYIYIQGAGRIDTVTLRPDTLHYGMQRFYAVDSGLLTYTRQDTIRVSTRLTNNDNAFDYLYFDGRRYDYNTGNTRISLESIPAGLHRLSFEHVPVEVFWEVAGRYNATVWTLPILVK